MRLEINSNLKIAKNTNIWRLNNMLLNNEWIIEEIKKQIKNTWRHNALKSVEHSKNSSKKEIHSNTSLP